MGSLWNEVQKRPLLLKKFRNFLKYHRLSAGNIINPQVYTRAHLKERESAISQQIKTKLL